MEITLEQVERLREKADVSYGQAKAALEYSGGNLLDALIYLEEQGVIPRPEDAYYSTKNEAPPPPPQELPVLQVKPEAKQAKQKKHKRRGRAPSAPLAAAHPAGQRAGDLAQGAAHHRRPHADSADFCDLFVLDRHSPADPGAVPGLPVSDRRAGPGERHHQRHDGLGGQHGGRCGPSGDGRAEKPARKV